MDALRSRLSLHSLLRSLFRRRRSLFEAVADLTAALGRWAAGPLTRAVQRRVQLGVSELEPRIVLSGNPPVAVNDAYSVHQGQTLTVAATSGVLANDTDAENDSLSAIVMLGPSHGRLSLGSNGSFTLTPTSGFSGT